MMARQYLGCPATSATVERLFSKVGIVFADKRKSAEAETLQDITFAQLNLPLHTYKVIIFENVYSVGM